MNKEVKKAVNKYNAMVFVLNGGSAKEATERFGIKLPIDALKRECYKVNNYACTGLIKKQKGEHYNLFRIKLKDLRLNKQAFIGKE